MNINVRNFSYLSYFKFCIRQAVCCLNMCHVILLHVIFVLVIKLFWFTRRPWGRCFLVWYVLHQCFGDQCSEVRNDEGECDEYGGGACGWKGDWYCREGPTNQVVKESTHVHTHIFTHSYEHAHNSVQMALWYTRSFTYMKVMVIFYTKYFHHQLLWYCMFFDNFIIEDMKCN